VTRIECRQRIHVWLLLWLHLERASVVSALLCSC
jgi:hypothetical protein